MAGTRIQGKGHTARFSLSITQAMEGQLKALLTDTGTAPMSDEAVQAVNDEAGVYQLFLDGLPVYVGKADKSLRQRLSKHYDKLSGRESETSQRMVERMSFKCLYVMEDLNAMAPERMLIKHFRQGNEAAWNTNGFGNNDPGRNRDRSMVKLNHFDRLHPIDLDVLVTLDSEDRDAQPSNLAGLMTAIKKSSPYLFRFPAKNNPDHKLLREPDDSLMQYKGQTKTAREWFELLSTILPAGWLITVLPGYVICYREVSPDSYQSRTGSWLTGQGGVSFTPHTPEFGKDGKIKDAAPSDDELGGVADEDD